DLITRAIRYMGVEARIVVMSYVSRLYTTSLMASSPSWIVNFISWCTVPIWSATFLAAARSGEPSNPTENECNWGHQASVVSSDSTLRWAYFLAMAEVAQESSPPESSTPYGTSDINWRCTAASKASFIAFILVSLSLTASYPVQSLVYHLLSSPSLLYRQC